MSTSKKIVVTGGAGFIGSHMADFYAKRGHKVVIVDNLSRSKLLRRKSDSEMDRHNIDRLREHRNITFVEADICEPGVVQNAAKNADAIIHTAAQVAVTTSLTDPQTDFKTNAVGTFNVLEAARKNNSAVIFTSTNKVYGDHVNDIPIKKTKTRYAFRDPSSYGVNESFSVDHTHHSPYGASKLAADLYVQEYAHTYGLKTAVFRMSCIYGTNQFGVEDQGWVAWFTIATQLNKPITIYGDGKQVRDVLFVDDLVRLADAFLKSDLQNTVLNVGGGINNTISLDELLTLLKKLTKKEPKLEFADWRPADQKVYISDIRKAKKILRWEPQISPSEGVGRLVEWVNEYFKPDKV